MRSSTNNYSFNSVDVVGSIDTDAIPTKIFLSVPANLISALLMLKKYNLTYWTRFRSNIPKMLGATSYKLIRAILAKEG